MIQADTLRTYVDKQNRDILLDEVSHGNLRAYLDVEKSSKDGVDKRQRLLPTSTAVAYYTQTCGTGTS